METYLEEMYKYQDIIQLSRGLYSTFIYLHYFYIILTKLQKKRHFLRKQKTYAFSIKA